MVARVKITEQPWLHGNTSNSGAQTSSICVGADCVVVANGGSTEVTDKNVPEGPDVIGPDVVSLGGNGDEGGGANGMMGAKCVGTAGGVVADDIGAKEVGADGM